MLQKKNTSQRNQTTEGRQSKDHRQTNVKYVLLDVLQAAAAAAAAATTDMKAAAAVWPTNWR